MYSLLWLDNYIGCKIPEYVFDDLSLSEILPKDVVEVLEMSVSADVLVARQQFFKLLKVPKNFDEIIRLKGKLDDFFRAKDAVHLYANDLVKAIRLISYAKTFVALLDMIYTIETNNIFLRNLKDVARTLDAKKVIIEQQISRGEAVLKKIENVCLKMPSMEFIDGRDLITAEEKFKNLSSCMGVELSREKKPLPITIPDTLCRLIKQNRQEYFEELKEVADNILTLVDNDILAIREDLSFYLTVHKFFCDLEQKGHYVSIPKISEVQMYNATDAYDFTLSFRGVQKIIANNVDFTVEKSVRFLNGANGGGKTSYLRTVAINLIFFRAGCPVCAREALIYPFKTVLTHFPKNENSLKGKLEYEQKRLLDIYRDLEQSGNCGFVFLNEAFSGSGEELGTQLSLEAIKKIRSDGNFGLFVTHFHNAVNTDKYPLSVQVEFDGSENKRTFRIIEGSEYASYAKDILKKYGLDAETLQRGITL